MREDSFGIGVELHDRAVLYLFLKRMVHNRARLVMFNLDRRFWTRPVAGPFNVSGNHIFRALKPFKTDDRSRSTSRRSALYAAVREGIDLFPIHGGLGQLHAGFHRYADPGIRNVFWEFLRVEPVNDPPRL